MDMKECVKLKRKYEEEIRCVIEKRINELYKQTGMSTESMIAVIDWEDRRYIGENTEKKGKVREVKLYVEL